MSPVLRNLFSKPYRSVSAAQAAALADGGAVLLDVREPHEWQAVCSRRSPPAPGIASPRMITIRSPVRRLGSRSRRR